MKKVVFFVFTLLLLCFQAQADVGETFSVGIPCGDESVDIPFTILSEEPKTVELAASSGRYRVEAPLTIPQTVRYHDADYTVVSIASRSFVGSWFTSITLPETVTSIGESAFQASDITEMVFPDNVTSIGSSALSMCYQLDTKGSANVTGDARLFGSLIKKNGSIYYTYYITASPILPVSNQVSARAESPASPQTSTRT